MALGIAMRGLPYLYCVFVEHLVGFPPSMTCGVHSCNPFLAVLPSPPPPGLFPRSCHLRPTASRWTPRWPPRRRRQCSHGRRSPPRCPGWFPALSASAPSASRPGPGPLLPQGLFASPLIWSGHPQWAGGREYLGKRGKDSGFRFQLTNSSHPTVLALTDRKAQV